MTPQNHDTTWSELGAVFLTVALCVMIAVLLAPVLIVEIFNELRLTFGREK